jgi:ketosteroid isomerase-like protein
MDRQDVAVWMTAYERAWRAPGVEALDDLFTSDAVYRQGPYEEPVTGLAAIGQMWEGERSGPHETFTMSSEVVAVDDDTAVVRVEVRYADPVDPEYRDLWVIRFDSDRRCREFEEWPFSPGQPISAE